MQKNKIPQILRWIRAGEGKHLDFKKTISSQAKIAKSLVAFANTEGGRLLVGVHDNGTVHGVKSEEEMFMIDAAAVFFCKPEVKIEFIEHIHDGKTILEVWIPASDQKPHYAKDEQGKWWVYIRVEDKSVLASKIVVDVLKKGNQPNLIEMGPKEQALLDYLSKNERITLKEFCKKLNISKWRASKILVKMISAGIIRNHTTEKTEFYTLS
jgi:predicted HTH transcriptional regulator